VFDTAVRPVVLVWELTRACALACDHCRAEAEPERHPDELTTAEGKALLEEAAAFGDGQVVVFSGGDPLERDDVTELVAHGEDLGLRTSLTPSGTTSLTEDRIADLADAGLGRMALSLDGATPASHDDFRGEDGSFEETLRAARAAREAGISLQVNTTVCASTVDDLPGVRDLVADLDAMRWSVFFLVPVGRGRVLDPVSPARADGVLSWLHGIRESAPFAVKTTEAPQFRRVSMRERGAPPPGTGDGSDGPGADRESAGPPAGTGRPSVLAGDGFAFVSHVGDVYPSGFLPASAGTVREDSLVDLYRESDLFTALRDRERLRGKCGACEYRDVCGGSRSRAYAHTGDPLASDPLCPYVPADYDGPVPGDDAWGGDGSEDPGEGVGVGAD
jgi:radical SAM protein